MFIITSEKVSLRNGEPLIALSETNGSVEFHNKLFDTNDCVVTEEPNENFIEKENV
jgi:hypothetical protein